MERKNRRERTEEDKKDKLLARLKLAFTPGTLQACVVIATHCHGYFLKFENKPISVLSCQPASKHFYYTEYNYNEVILMRQEEQALRRIVTVVTT